MKEPNGLMIFCMAAFGVERDSVWAALIKDLDTAVRGMSLLIIKKMLPSIRSIREFESSV